jgi:iron complex transport system permease protein
MQLRRGAVAKSLWWLAPPVVALLLLALAVVLAVSVGSVRIPLIEVVQAIGRGVLGDTHTTHDTIIWQVRLPHVLSAALVGGALALSGAAYQGIFRNPLAEPYLLGVVSGAGLGAALDIVFAGSLTLGVPLLSFAGALVSVFTVVALARRGGRLPIVSLILAGVVMGSLASAATSFVMLLDQEKAAAVLAWLLGSFALSSWSKLTLLAPVVLITALVLWGSSRALNLLQLGDAQAAQLGLNIETVKFALIAVSTLSTSVSLAGIIGFVGLMVPHAVRLLLGPDHRTLLPMSLILGGLFMVLADLAARTLISPAELPVGIITALTGAPFFLWLLKRQSTGSL